jgi:hypothetical protein
MSCPQPQPPKTRAKLTLRRPLGCTWRRSEQQPGQQQVTLTAYPQAKPEVSR